ncbi:uncharacterized protein LOC115099557 [Rhinatrema bivittatum]|uniref:uncharacterized protein LOC115099557 n=1 Tax=Rhinatrema bivittatum TaxID=194408 RepID=UPI001129906C|nr:uncharacterized protein LOC115099557 [Rhinatrema bivittatum]XP_029473158.1 uncharacterized protein LOC115099557 [Rhinatrema bivittatum]
MPHTPSVQDALTSATCSHSDHSSRMEFLPISLSSSSSPHFSCCSLDHHSYNTRSSRSRSHSGEPQGKRPGNPPFLPITEGGATPQPDVNQTLQHISSLFSGMMCTLQQALAVPPRPSPIHSDMEPSIPGILPLLPIPISLETEEPKIPHPPTPDLSNLPQHPHSHPSTPSSSTGYPSDPEEEPQQPYSPPEDLAYPKFIEKVGNALHLEIQKVPDPRTDALDLLKIFDLTSEPTSLPSHKVLDTLLEKSWETPYNLPSVSRKTDIKYKLKQSPYYATPQLPHSSVVVESALQKVKKSRTHSNTPPGKDHKSLDDFAKKTFQSAMLAARIGQHQFYMVQYLYDSLQQIKTLIPPATTDLGTPQPILDMEEGIRHLLRSIYESFETTSCTSASAIAARRIAWLRASAIRDDVHDKLANLPC